MLELGEEKSMQQDRGIGKLSENWILHQPQWMSGTKLDRSTLPRCTLPIQLNCFLFSWRTIITLR